MTPDEVLAVLASGDFDRLVDESENGQVEFKGELYDLSSDWGKAELTKDVVAFANGYEDGVIVVGAKTIQPADSPFERVAEVSPIERPLVDEKQHLDVIKARCYPSIRDLTVTAYPSRADGTRVLLAIAIPAQHEDDQPFLLLHPLSAEGSKVQGWLIGLPTRAVDQTDHARASELHGWIRGGRSVGRRLDEIVVLIGGSQGGAPDATAIEPPGSDRGTAPDLMSPYPEGGLRYRPLNAAIRLATEPEHAGSGIVMPTLYLAAEARRGASVPTIFHEGGVRETLESPPVTRHDGWNLVTLDHAEIVEGTHLRLTSGRRKLIELYAKEEGLFHALAVYDGGAETFDLAIDMHYKVPKVVDIAGSPGAPPPGYAGLPCECPWISRNARSRAVSKGPRKSGHITRGATALVHLRCAKSSAPPVSYSITDLLYSGAAVAGAVSSGVGQSRDERLMDALTWVN